MAPIVILGSVWHSIDYDGPCERICQPPLPAHPSGPAVPHASSAQGDAGRSDGADMGRATQPGGDTQIYSNQTTTVPPSSHPSHSTTTAPSPANATSAARGGALQSAASLSGMSASLPHLYCEATRTMKRVSFPTFCPIRRVPRRPA